MLKEFEIFANEIYYVARYLYQMKCTNLNFLLQFHYFYKVFEKAKGMDNWTDSVYAFIKGPGWFPGTPRLGDPMGVPAVSKTILAEMLSIFDGQVLSKNLEVTKIQ